MKRDFEQKINDIRRVYKEKQMNGLLLENQSNINWLLKGRTFINMASVRAVADLLITDDAVYLIVNNIEMRRLIEEEFSYLDFIVKEYSWYKDEERTEIINTLTDSCYAVDSELESEIVKLRLVMTNAEQGTYKELGKDAANAMEASCFQVKRKMSERMVAALMAQECIIRGIEPLILLVAADERIMRYRHPLPTSKRIEKEVMLVLGGRRNGQCIALTRFVSFSEPSTRMKQSRDAVSRIDALLFSETRPGRNVKEIFRMLIEAYGMEGYPKEWEQHHQGGLISYNPREIKVNFHTDLEVEVGQVYAWNPSITGFKAEDTFIVEESENTTITVTEQLPYYSIACKQGNFMRPDILIRNIM